jgi:hypothetical protein
MEPLTFEQSLIERGINPPLAAKLAAGLDGPAIERTIAWYDRESEKREITAGVLVAELRRGGRPATQVSLMQREISYGNEIVAWLRRHFPQWNRETGNRTHPGAIACVIGLHHRHGKGSLSVREHGAEIREAVERFDARHGSPGGEG